MISSFSFVGSIRREGLVRASHNFDENRGIVKDELFAVFVCIWMSRECKLQHDSQSTLLPMAPDLLDPSALIATLPSLLPEGKKTLDSPQDAIAALLHTALIAVSFRLTPLS